MWRTTCWTHSKISEYIARCQTESENFCIQHSKMYLVQCRVKQHEPKVVKYYISSSTCVKLHIPGMWPPLVPAS